MIEMRCILSLNDTDTIVGWVCQKSIHSPQMDDLNYAWPPPNASNEEDSASALLRTNVTAKHRLSFSPKSQAASTTSRPKFR